MFKIGDKIVCINSLSSVTLVKDEIYTIVGFRSNRFPNSGIQLKEISPLKSNCFSYKMERFRKVDYNYGEAVLTEIIEQVKEDELVRLN